MDIASLSEVSSPLSELSSSEGRELERQFGSFRLNDLPQETKANVIQKVGEGEPPNGLVFLAPDFTPVPGLGVPHADLVAERQAANTAMQNFRQTSRASNDLVMNTPLRDEAAALQRHPGASREQAAYHDFMGHHGAPQALPMEAQQALREHHVSDPGIIATLNWRNAERDQQNGMQSLQVVAKYNLTGRDADMIKIRGANADRAHMDLEQAILNNEMDNPEDIALLRRHAAGLI